jgi:hypothetical protein
VVLLNVDSSQSIFGNTVSFNDIVNFSTPIDELKPVFTLTENNPSRGTRIQLDNVLVDAVPIPGAVWLLGCGLTGLVGIRRNCKD